MTYKNLYILFILLILNSCVSKKDKFMSNLETVVEYVSTNQDSLTVEMLEAYNYKIIELRENKFPICRSKMTADEINKVKLSFGKYNDLKISIQIGEFISNLETVVESVSQKQDSLSTETLEVYNSKIIELRENQFSIYRSQMTIEEINKVNVFFGRYDALIIKIQLNEIKNKFNDGLVQGSNMLDELFSKETKKVIKDFINQ